MGAAARFPRGALGAHLPYAPANPDGTSNIIRDVARASRPYLRPHTLRSHFPEHHEAHFVRETRTTLRSWLQARAGDPPSRPGRRACTTDRRAPASLRLRRFHSKPIYNYAWSDAKPASSFLLSYTRSAVPRRAAVRSAPSLYLARATSDAAPSLARSAGRVPRRIGEPTRGGDD